MADVINTYGDISPRTAAYAAKQLLTRAQEQVLLERFGQAKPIPKNSSTSIKFRRYRSLALATTALSEGVTPDAEALEYDDYTATLAQYGKPLKITDVIEDTHEDPVLKEMSGLCGENAADTFETLRYNVLRAGTNVFYASGVISRTTVNNKITLGDFRKVFRAFKRDKARPITEIVSATPNIATEPIGASYIALCHTDLDADLRAVSGFVPIEKYSQTTKALPNEIGKVDHFRILTSSLFTPWETAGASGTTYLSGGDIVSSAANADVYPILCLSKDAYGLVCLQGAKAVEISVLNPSKKDKSDPMGQRGYVSWKGYDATVILNQSWIARIEVAATADLT